VKRASGGLASFLGADDLSCPGAWHMSGAELSLDPPARVAGYQARIADKPAPHIDSVRFLFRSYAAPGRTMPDAYVLARRLEAASK
jgi:hypothetical protein